MAAPGRCSYSPGPSMPLPISRWEEGSSFSHLDETTYPAISGNALMTPAIHFGETEHDLGPIVLGMFQDMGWPTSGSPAATTIGDYHVAAPDRLISAHVTTNSAPLHLQVAGVDGVPASGVKAAVVTVRSRTPRALGSGRPFRTARARNGRTARTSRRPKPAPRSPSCRWMTTATSRSRWLRPPP